MVIYHSSDELSSQTHLSTNKRSFSIVISCVFEELILYETKDTMFLIALWEITLKICREVTENIQ